MTKGISIRYLNKSFGRFKLQNIDVEMPRGYVTAIIGNNILLSVHFDNRIFGLNTQIERIIHCKNVGC